MLEVFSRLIIKMYGCSDSVGLLLKCMGAQTQEIPVHAFTVKWPILYSVIFNRYLESENLKQERLTFMSPFLPILVVCQQHENQILKIILRGQYLPKFIGA